MHIQQTQGFQKVVMKFDGGRCVCVCVSKGGGFNTMQYLLFLQQNRIELEQMKKLKIMNDT